MGLFLVVFFQNSKKWHFWATSKEILLCRHGLPYNWIFVDISTISAWTLLPNVIFPGHMATLMNGGCQSSSWLEADVEWQGGGNRPVPQSACLWVRFSCCCHFCSFPALFEPSPAPFSPFLQLKLIYPFISRCCSSKRLCVSDDLFFPFSPCPGPLLRFPLRFWSHPGKLELKEEVGKISTSLASSHNCP